MTYSFKIILTVLAMFTWLLLLAGCEDSLPLAGSKSRVTSENGMISIEDIDGKVWDITHAVNQYGFDPEGFKHGVGGFAIRPIQSPSFFCPGEANYPPDSDFLVIGTSLNGHTRAYPISTMSAREIANDEFGEAYVSIAY